MDINSVRPSVMPRDPHGKKSVISGFSKRAYNSPMGTAQPQYQQQQPAQPKLPVKTMAAGGIAAVGYGVQKSHQRNIKSQVSKAKELRTSAKAAKPTLMEKTIGGGAMDEFRNRQINAKGDASMHMRRAKQLKAQGALKWKSKARSLKKGFMNMAKKVF